MHSRLQLLNYECSSTEICGLNFQRAAQDLICIDLLLTSGYCCSLLLVLGFFYFLFLWSTLWSLSWKMLWIILLTLPTCHLIMSHAITEYEWDCSSEGWFLAELQDTRWGRLIQGAVPGGMIGSPAISCWSTSLFYVLACKGWMGQLHFSPLGMLTQVDLVEFMQLWLLTA